MKIEFNIKCLWQHPATSIHLEITEIEWSEISDPILLAALSLRQLQPGDWQSLIEPRTEELTNLLSALQDFTKFPHFKYTHPLTRHLVEKLTRQCKSSASDDQATSSKRNKTNFKKTNSMVEMS